MMRWDIINHLIKQYGYKTYLEIGYYKGWSLDRVECEFKIAVDPNPSKTPEQEKWEMGSSHPFWFVNDEYVTTSYGAIHKKTSDDFFATNQVKFDIIFVDGLHTAEQAYKDVRNAFLHLSPGGVVVMHDCNPATLEHTTTGVEGCWTGDVYKAAAAINRSPGVEFLCVDTDYGVGVIRRVAEEIHWIDPDTNPPIFWNFFNTHRKTSIGLVSPEEWLEYEQLIHT